ncbi:uncharacterized protein G2W53_008740 [Senna tora]|uniref:DUF1995 domain-containing protein n=1 Tax=Senna tora TaxID=362788 RepID=A0A835C964_9FABA|nr:uncharacterized protein G2W53_008740 [Senna tora]
MASYLHRSHFLSILISNPITPPSHSQTQFRYIQTFPTPFPLFLRQHHHFPSVPLKATPTSIIQSSLSSPTPPSSKEEAINQAKTSLSASLEKPLNNPKLIGKLKKLKQPKFRVEIPVVDDSPESLSQLALNVFVEMPIRRKGSPIKFLILWPNPTLKEASTKAFLSHSSTLVEHVDISSITKTDPRVLNSADVAIFLVPEASQLALMKTVTDAFYPKPVVLFNPKWAFEEEGNFGDLSGFVGSFEVVYSFMGLEVRGLLSKRKGVIFKCVRDGVVSGERWIVLVEEEGEMKLVSKFKARPTIGEVENVLYNLMAINSPVTKSAKFLRDLVSNVTGKK